MNNFKLANHQVRAIEYSKKHPKFILSMGCGTGKSITALFCAAFTGCKTVIIIGPPSLKKKWEREIDLFFSFGERHKLSPDSVRFKSFMDKTYEKTMPDCVIMDEGHKYLKNWNSNRPHIELGMRSKRAIILTATSILNTPSELYWPLKICGAYNQSLNDFKLTYSAGKSLYGRPHVIIERGFTNIPQLVKLFNKCTFVYKKKINVEFKHLLLDDNKMIKNDPNFNDISAMESVLAAMKSQEEKCVKYLNDIRKKHKKVVVFYFHKVLNQVLNPGMLYIDGSIPPEKRYSVIDIFQKMDKSILFMNSASCGVGLDVEGADAVVFLQIPWSPGAMHQNYMRCYRFFRKKVLTVYTISYKEELRQLTEERKRIMDGFLAYFLEKEEKNG